MLAAGFAACTGAQGTGLDWWVAPSTQKVFPGDTGTGEQSAALWAARGEYESVQVVLRSEEGLEGLRVTLEPVAGDGFRELPVEWVSLFEVFYVDTPGVAQWGFPEDRPERRLPRYPDPLVPLTGGVRDGTLDLEAGEARAVWVRVHVPSDAEPGRYGGRVTVRGGRSGNDSDDGVLAEAPVELTVWNFEIPRVSSLRTAIGLGGPWMAEIHGVAPWSSEYWDIYARYYDKLLDYRISAYWIPGSSLVDPTDARAVRHMQDERVTSFMYANVNEETWTQLQELGVGHKAYYFSVDEPRAKAQYEEFRERARNARRVSEDVRVLLPFYGGPDWDEERTPFDELAGYVDIWVSQTDYYHHGHGLGTRIQEQMRERFEAGDETWLYVALAPREPFCNIMVNNSALQHRILFWQIYREDLISGFLYWSASFWRDTDDPFADIATVKNIDPHIWGDGSLFYPGVRFGIDGPLPSVRLECIRDGLQDYEYLKLAEELLGREEVMRLVREITTSLTEYNEDGAVFAAIRGRLGEALSATSAEREEP